MQKFSYFGAKTKTPNTSLLTFFLSVLHMFKIKSFFCIKIQVLIQVQWNPDNLNPR